MGTKLETIDLVDIRAEIVGEIIKSLPLLSAEGAKTVFLAVDRGLDKFAEKTTTEERKILNGKEMK